MRIADYLGREAGRSHAFRLGSVIWLVSLVAVFARPLYQLAVHAAHSNLDSYIVLVPFVSAYLIYIRRKQIPKEYGFSPWAIVPLLAGLVALTAALTVH